MLYELVSIFLRFKLKSSAYPSLSTDLYLEEIPVELFEQELHDIYLNIYLLVN